MKKWGKGKRRVTQLKEEGMSAAFKGEPSLTDLNGGRGMSVAFGSRWAEVVDHLKVTVRLEAGESVNAISECSARNLCNYPGNSLRLWIVLTARRRILLENLVVSQLVKNTSRHLGRPKIDYCFC